MRQVLVAGQAKVTNASLTGCVDEDVGRLEVTMYYGRICSLQADMPSVGMCNAAHAHIRSHLSTAKLQVPFGLLDEKRLCTSDTVDTKQG